MILVSARQPENFGLTDCATTQGVAPKVYLVTIVIHPFDGVTEFAKSHIAEALGRTAKEFEDFAVGDNRSKVDDRLEAVEPSNLDDAVDNGLDRRHANDLAHGIFPGLRPSAMSFQACISSS